MISFTIYDKVLQNTDTKYELDSRSFHIHKKFIYLGSMPQIKATVYYGRQHLGDFTRFRQREGKRDMKVSATVERKEN